MTSRLCSDISAGFCDQPALLELLSSEEEIRAGIRVTRAEFARMMGCSRQAVTDWVKSGRLTVGPDGRFDPRQAVASLLRTGDPARIRAKVLEPLVRDIGLRERRIHELEALLSESRENAMFHEGAASELLELFSTLKEQIAEKWAELRMLPADLGLSVFLDWLDHALQCGGVAGPLMPVTGRSVAVGGEGETKVASGDTHQRRTGMNTRSFAGCHWLIQPANSEEEARERVELAIAEAE